jgi:hypothetical protein
VETDELLKFVAGGTPRCCEEDVAISVESTDEGDIRS